MINVIASIFIKKGKMPDILNIYRDFAPQVNQEKGCIQYQPTLDLQTEIPTQQLDENIITVIETWESLEDFHNHLNAPHVLQFREDIKGTVDKVSIKVLKSAMD